MRKRRTKLIIDERQGDTEDETGGFGGGQWVEVDRIWGAVTFTTGSREQQEGRIKGHVPVRVEIPFLLPVNELRQNTKRIRFLDDTVLIIHSIYNDQMKNRTRIIQGVINTLETA